MNREDVLRIAREVGIPEFEEVFSANSDDLGRFAAAILSATKEEDADICDELEMRNKRAVGPADCGVAIRISK